MKKIKLALILLISIFILSGCFGGDFGDDMFSDINGETYQLSGEIIDLQGIPVENVEVRINGKVTYTDANGLYNLESIEGGSSYIELESDSYRNLDADINISSDTSMDFVMVENEVVYAAQTSGNTSGYFQLKRPGGTEWDYEIYLETLDGEAFDQTITFTGGHYSITDEYTYFLAETDNPEVKYLMGIADHEYIIMSGLTEAQFLTFKEEYETLDSGQPQIDFINANIDQGNVYEGETVFFERLDNEDLEYKFIAEGILNESDLGQVENGEWTLHRFGNKRFDPDFSYTLVQDDNSQSYHFVNYNGGVSSRSETEFYFALDLLETNSNQNYYVYGFSGYNYIKIAVVEINIGSEEDFKNIYSEDPSVTKSNIMNVIEKSNHIIYGEVNNFN